MIDETCSSTWLSDWLLNLLHDVLQVLSFLMDLSSSIFPLFLIFEGSEFWMILYLWLVRNTNPNSLSKVSIQYCRRLVISITNIQSTPRMWSCPATQHQCSDLLKNSSICLTKVSEICICDFLLVPQVEIEKSYINHVPRIGCHVRHIRGLKAQDD